MSFSVNSTSKTALQIDVYAPCVFPQVLLDYKEGSCRGNEMNRFPFSRSHCQKGWAHMRRIQKRQHSEEKRVSFPSQAPKVARNCLIISNIDQRIANIYWKQQQAFIQPALFLLRQVTVLDFPVLYSCCAECLKGGAQLVVYPVKKVILYYAWIANPSCQVFMAQRDLAKVV